MDGTGEAPAIRGISAKQACTVLYNRLPPLDAAQAEALLRLTTGQCKVEWANPSATAAPLTAGLAKWGDHRVVMIALRAPVRQEVLDRTVAVSPMPDDLRGYMLSHKAAIRLLYVGDDPDPLEQLTALYGVAGALLAQGGIGLLNERAALALPASLALNFLPGLGADSPPISLWTGAITFSLDDTAASQPYFMRTYGMEQLVLPELGIYMSDRALADDVYHILINMALYVVEEGTAARVGPGSRAEFKGHTYLFTDPGSRADEFSSPSGLLLLVEV